MRGVSVPPELFDEDYLYFYADVLGDDRSDADARVVARLLSLQPGMRVLDVLAGRGGSRGLAARWWAWTPASDCWRSPVLGIRT